MHANVLITPRELHLHLADPGWVICDCRFNLEDPGWGRGAYLEGHIPGAQYVDLETDLSSEPTGQDGRHPLPGVDTLSALFSRLGIRSDTNVVAYDASGGPYAARLWWSLEFLGHDQVTVLDGGFPAWKRAGYPLQDGWERARPADFPPRPRGRMIAHAQEIRASLGNANPLLIDARSGERFRGEQEPYDPVAGHIPGAVNRYWQDNLDADGNFLPPERLRREFEALLETKSPEQTVSYCGSGVTAAHNLLAMAYAGLPGGRMYPGSWSEWSADAENPISPKEPESET